VPFAWTGPWVAKRALPIAPPAPRAAPSPRAAAGDVEDVAQLRGGDLDEADTWGGSAVSEAAAEVSDRRFKTRPWTPGLASRRGPPLPRSLFRECGLSGRSPSCFAAARVPSHSSQLLPLPGGPHTAGSGGKGRGGRERDAQTLPADAGVLHAHSCGGGALTNAPHSPPHRSRAAPAAPPRGAACWRRARRAAACAPIAAPRARPRRPRAPPQTRPCSTWVRRGRGGPVHQPAAQPACRTPQLQPACPKT
jgi:hypothetical protein